MLIRKCDICGAEIEQVETSYVLKAKGIREHEYDICKRCINRIIGEIKDAMKWEEPEV